MSSSSKRRGVVGQDDEPRPSRRRHAAGRRKLLYLVLDDWKNGFSIYKIDPDALVDEGQGQGHLPEPPVVRLESPMGSVHHDRVFFSALGTKMLVFMNHRCAVVYDTETAAVSVGPHAPARMLCGSGVTVPAGGMVYALSHRYFDKEDPHAFHLMMQQQGKGGGWSWKTLPEPPPAELDAWVGLNLEGYVCCCRVASRSSDSESSSIIMTKEKLAYDYEGCWGDNRAMASLTYMNTSKFCVVETMMEDEDDDYCLAHQLRLTMFGLKYDRTGELRITNRRSTRSYLVSRHRYNFVPFAWWI
ncbi:hypothetical protein SORBI_3002G426600 [Sorghum bicolor]|uniref:DUF1618 domain-containing protein n=1 Tax=Sorghum bicolor TaxID=4558 RepID=A0A1W0W813_SORBI|nr:hypothetical protein SORBI_3002G426600 [Sorghum bicolor]